MLEKTFTGNLDVFNRISKYLQLQCGFAVKDGIHVGNDRYEFKNITMYVDGINWESHTILSWIENDEVEYKTCKTGSFMEMD